MYPRWLTIVFAVLAWSVDAYAIPVTLHFSGKPLHVAGEFINGVPVANNLQEFAPLFQNGQTITVAITFDTNQPDIDPDPNTGTYRIGTLSVNIPELGLAASRSSNSMQISAFNNTPNPDDQFFADVSGVDSFSNNVGLPSPQSFSALFTGNTSMLADDKLPTSSLNWTFGNVSFNFTAHDGTLRQVLMTFPPVQATGPICDIQLNKTTFVNGNQVMAQVARLANPGSTPVPVEVKLWFEVPGSPPVPFLTMGADGSFVLSPGFNTDFGPLPLATVQASFPRGPYSFNCRLLHAVTGAPLAEDFNPFQLQ